MPFIFLIIGATFFLDQITKNLAEKYLADEPFQIFGNFFQLIVHKNSGIAFSLHLPLAVIIFATYVLLAIGIYIAYKDLDLTQKRAQLFLGLILGGAFGNLVDRIFQGQVTDFFAVANYPVFNVADIAIVAGLAGIVIWYGKIKK